MKILVTGGGGYIGCILVQLLEKEGFEVIVYDRFFFGRDLLKESEKIELLQGDIRFINKDIFKDVYAVIDLAALSNDPSGDLFQKSTREINHIGRVEVAKKAKQSGVVKYILPSSCSIYGFQGPDVIANETTKTNPLTTYAKANEEAENGVLKLADNEFTVVILRQSTVYGFSPRMRFDLAINGMTFGAWKNRKLPLMRDGNQWRPMVHVEDTALAMIFMLKEDSKNINKEIFNVGSDENNYQLKELGNIVAKEIGDDVEIEWYGDPDERSYRVSCKKINKLGFFCKKEASFGVKEILQKLQTGELERSDRDITLEWYKKLVYWDEYLRSIKMKDSLIDIK
jgi:nucleoside-diphosphate-sugar epimerase